jgi:Carboxypeptidase regulatory-like domain
VTMKLYRAWTACLSLTILSVSLTILPGAPPAKAQTLTQQPTSAVGRYREVRLGLAKAHAPLFQLDSSQQSAPQQPADERAESQNQAADQRLPGLPGSIGGRVVDQTGAVIAGAQVRLRSEGPSAALEAQTGDDGQFSFSSVAPGNFRLEVTAEGFASKTVPVTLHSGENEVVPQIALIVLATTTEVQVTPSLEAVAEEQIKEEEKQRVLGVFPNFYVTYVRDAAPLNPRQKFELAWKSTVDPVNFAVTGAVAGFEQSQDEFNGYGQGAQGYGKRYGAAFADSVSSTFIGGAILPSLLKQDPRYFYKGTGSTRSRFLYALASAVICKGDNGRWQANYSNILGNLASGGISNLYYAGKDRDGPALTFENTLIGIGATAATNLLQEFVVRKFTPGASSHPPDKPQGAITKIWTKVVHDGN